MMIADQLDAARTQTLSRHSAGPAEEAMPYPVPGLMTDLEDLAKHATQIQDRLDQLRARLSPVLADGPASATIDDEPALLTPAQHQVRAIAVTLHAIDDQISFLLDGIRL